MILSFFIIAELFYFICLFFFREIQNIATNTRPDIHYKILMHAKTSKSAKNN